VLGRAAILLILLGALAFVEGRTDPATNRVRVIMLGEISEANALFLQWIDDNPKFTLKRIACAVLITGSVREGKRLVRVYMPRSKERLESEHDVAVFEDFTPLVIPVQYLDWFQQCVSEGMGIALIEYVNWGGTNDIHMWMAMEFYDLFPANVYMNDYPAAAGRTFYRVTNQGGPLDIPDIESTPMNSGHHGDMQARQAATVEGVWRGRGTPAMVTSTYGEGNTLQLAHGWDNIPSRFYTYMPDYIYNTLFSIAGIPFPEDFDLIHSIREMFISFNHRKRATLAVLEFVEKFGANPTRAEAELDSMYEEYARASELYLEASYVESSELLRKLIEEEFTRVDQELMMAKDSALFWIYVIEWTTVSSVGLLCGSIVWFLMIRRRLYRSVGTTRMV
jgi:hypothetical protein